MINTGEELIFKANGPFAMCELRRTECDGNMAFIHKDNSNKVIQGVFSLKNLGSAVLIKANHKTV